MNIARSLRRIYDSAGRLLDFGGSYNAALWKQQMETPGWLCDRIALAHDAKLLAQDMKNAALKLEKHYGRKVS